MGAEERNYVRRRRVPRREYQSRVGLLVRGRYTLVDSLQIGEGGMMIQTRESIAINQRVVVSFRLPNSPHIVVRGQIRYRMEPDARNPVPKYGIQFENIDFNAKRLIRNFVATKEVEDLPTSKAA